MRLLGVVIGDVERAEEGFMRGYLERDMIETGTFPCGARLLPLPYVVIGRHFCERAIVSPWNTKKDYA